MVLSERKAASRENGFKPGYKRKTDNVEANDTLRKTAPLEKPAEASQFTFLFLYFSLAINFFSCFQNRIASN